MMILRSAILFHMSSATEQRTKRDSAETEFKVVLLGDVDVGKTSLLVRFVDNSWDKVMDPTIGQTFLKSVIQVDNEEVTLRIWDTPGDERYASANIMAIRDADCCVIVYDVADPEGKSYALIPTIIDRYKSVCNLPNAFVVVVGNKCDLIASNLQDTELERLDEAQTNFRLKSFLASAKTGEGVGEIFRFVAAKLLEHAATRMTVSTSNIVDLAKTVDKSGKKGCC
jgi:small GTP-binding protein